MLVLTRKHDEQIVIGSPGEEIIITVLKIQGSEKVSIGIQAHQDIPIFRRELLDGDEQSRKGKHHKRDDHHRDGRQHPRDRQGDQEREEEESPALLASDADLDRLAHLHHAASTESCCKVQTPTQYLEERHSYHP